MAKTASVLLGLLIFVYILLQSSLVTAIWADDLSEKPVEEKRELVSLLTQAEKNNISYYLFSFSWTLSEFHL